MAKSAPPTEPVDPLADLVARLDQVQADANRIIDERAAELKALSGQGIPLGVVRQDILRGERWDAVVRRFAAEAEAERARADAETAKVRETTVAET